MRYKALDLSDADMEKGVAGNGNGGPAMAVDEDI
jgi:hypothetical protein